MTFGEIGGRVVGARTSASAPQPCVRSRAWRRAAAFTITSAVAFTSLLASPAVVSAASGSGAVTLTADASLGQSLEGPTGGGTAFQVNLPSFPFAGRDHTGAVDGTYYALIDGAVRSWRIGSEPQVSRPGPGYTQIASVASAPPGGVRPYAIGTVYALHGSTGRVFALGEGGNGQLGNGANASSSTWVQVALPDVASTGAQYVSIAAGEHTGYALDAHGGLYAWGYMKGATGGYGFSSVPVKLDIPDGAHLTRMWAGELAWYGWTADNRMYTWEKDIINAGDPFRPSFYGEILPASVPPFTPPGPPATPSGVVDNVIFEGTGVAARPVATNNGVAVVTTPNVYGQCGRFDVRVDYTYGGVAVSEVIDDGFTVNTPCSPTDVVATAGDGRASVSFSPPPTVPGVPAPVSYTVTATPLAAGPATVTKIGYNSPIVVEGLVNGRDYRISVVATNVNGTGTTFDQINGFQGVIDVTPLAGHSSGLSITGVPASITYGDAGFTLATAGGEGTGAVTFSVPFDNGVVAVNPTTGATTVLGAGAVSVTATKAASLGVAQQSVTVGITVGPRQLQVIGLDATLRPGQDRTTSDYPSVIYPPLVGTDTMDLVWGQGWHFSVGTGEFTVGQCRRIGIAGGNQSVTSASPNYTVSFFLGTACVAEPQAPLSITGVPASVNVGDAPFTVGTSGGSSTSTVRFSVPAQNGVLAIDPVSGAVTVLGAGTVPVIATKAGDSTYGPVSAARWVIVGEEAVLQDQATLSVTGLPTSVTYGQDGFTLGNAGGSGSGAVTYSLAGDNGVLSLDAATGAVTVVGAGTVTVSATKAGDATYHPATASVSVTVAKRQVTVTADNQTKKYGAADPALTFAVSPPLVGSDTLAGSLTYSGVDVGTHPITQGTAFAHPNYTVTFVAGTMAITPAEQSALSITGVPSTVTYGDAPFTLGTSGGSGPGSVTYSAPADNGVASVNPTTGAVTVLGAGTVEVTARKAASAGYAVASTSTQLTVVQRSVTVTAVDRTKVFGNADPELSYTVSPALVDGDSLAGALAHTGTDVGTYPITQATAFAHRNYDVTFVAGTMTITPAGPTALSIDGLPSTLTYGDGGFTLDTSGGSGTGAVTYSVPADNGVLDVAPTGAVTIVGAGTVQLTAVKAPDRNHFGSSANVTITVDELAVTVTATDQTKEFGGADPELTFTVSPALIGDDTLVGSLAYEGSDVGTYAIVEGVGFAGDNYIVTFVAGTITITQSAATQAVIHDVASLLGQIETAHDADRVAQITNALADLSAGERRQIPAAVLTALADAQASAGEYNHTDAGSGVTAAGESLPWSVRLGVSERSADEGETIAVQQPGTDVLALYDLSFDNTLTGGPWVLGGSEPVTFAIERAAVTDRENIAIVHLSPSGGLSTLPAVVGVDGTVTFEANSGGRYGVSAKALDRTVVFHGNGRVKSKGWMTSQVTNAPSRLNVNTFSCAAYRFVGWNTEADGSGTAYADGAVFGFRTDVTLHAQWVKNGNGNDNGGGNGAGRGECR